MSATSESRFHEIKATGELPSPSGIALALLELIQRDDTTIADIARVLQGDPALTGRLLKFVDSPFVGQRRAVASVSDAILLVGLHAVRQIVVGLSVLSGYRNGKCTGFDYDRFWTTSLARAVAAEALSARYLGCPPEEAFTCGPFKRRRTARIRDCLPTGVSGRNRRGGGRPSNRLPRAGTASLPHQSCRTDRGNV
jgi:two-component system cell cycle response regulator